MKENKEKERIKYKVFPMRLHEETKKILMAKQKESGLSWNLYIYKLLKEQK